MIAETLFGGIFGGLLRLAPEILKVFDRKDERKHELALLEREMEFAKVRAEAAMREKSVEVSYKEMDAIGKAFEEQSNTAKSAGWFVAAVSALVRPSVTYMFVGLYALVKLASYLLAVQSGADWKIVVTTMWGVEDMATLNMILTFWFVGRVYERK